MRLAILAASIFLLTSCRSDSTVVAKAEAIEMARAKMFGLSKKLKDHIQIESTDIVVKEVIPSDDGGWHVTLVAKTCEYAIYAKPGKEIDVAGMSGGCLILSSARPKTPI